MNRELAVGSLKSNVKRLKRNPDLLGKYDTIIQDQLKKGIIEKCYNMSTEYKTHYIPHNVVITQQKTTTKVRVVYDASAKTRRENLSFNDCLYRGPVMLHDLGGLLLRFRLHNTAMVADIGKAFLQVGLQQTRRDVTRFVWLKDIDNKNVEPSNIQEYRFCRVPFGVKSSPFLLGATTEEHLGSYNKPVAET